MHQFNFEVSNVTKMNIAFWVHFIFVFLFDMTEKVRFFFNAIRLGELAVVEKELADKPNLIDVIDDRGSSPLILASYYNRG